MTIDQRLDRLTERHEALTQAIELMVLENRDRNKRFTEQQAEWDKRFAEQKAEAETRQKKLDKTFAFVGESLAKLAGVAQMHQHRLDSHDDRLDTLEETSGN